MSKRVLAIVAVLLGMVALGVWYANQKPEADSSEIVVAQWGSEKYLIYLPLYIAEEAGFLEKRGIRLKIEYSGNDDQVFAKVLRGDAQFGVGDPIFTAISRQQGADGVVLASIVDRVALWGVSKSDAPATAAQGFAGKRIGTFPRPSTTYTLLNDTIATNNVRGSEILEVPIGSELSLLESDSADIVMLLEPAASLAEDQGYHIVTSFPKIWGKFAFTGLTSTEKYVSNNKETADAMISALQEAVELAHSDRDRAVKIAQSLFPNVKSTVIANAVNRMLNDETLPQSVIPDQSAWEESMAVRKRVGDVEKDNSCSECLYKSQ